MQISLVKTLRQEPAGTFAVELAFTGIGDEGSARELLKGLEAAVDAYAEVKKGTVRDEAPLGPVIIAI